MRFGCESLSTLVKSSPPIHRCGPETILNFNLQWVCACLRDSCSLKSSNIQQTYKYHNIPLSPPYLSTNQLNTACKWHIFKQTHHYQQIVSQPHALPCSLSAKAGDTHPFRRSSLAFAPNLLHQTAYWTDYVQLFFIRYRTTPLTEGYRLPLYVLCLPSGGI